MEERFIDDKEAALRTNLSRSWFQKKRVYGGGPPCGRVPGSRAVRYPLSKFIEWFEMEGLRHSVAEIKPDRHPHEMGFGPFRWITLDDDTVRPVLRHKRRGH